MLSRNAKIEIINLKNSDKNSTLIAFPSKDYTQTLHVFRIIAWLHDI